MAKPQPSEEKRRFRAAIAAHATAALVMNRRDDGASVQEIARTAVKLADAVMMHLEATDPYKE